MDTLFEKHRQKISQTYLDFKRGVLEEIEWNSRLIGIRGARGIGKTTMLLQYIKKYLPNDQSALYVSMDNIWFSNNTLVDFVDNFVKHGGKYLFLDEVHKYPNWSQELKNCYDDYPNLKIVFTGSSLLEILNARADLSRRDVVYNMQGLSFREYLNLELKTNFKTYTLTDILNNHIEIATEITEQIRPLQHFENYLKYGYYPFFKESINLYYSKIEEVINLIMDIELPLLRNVQPAYIPKFKQLLLIISESAPFMPNVNKLSERIGINRTTFVTYLHYLQNTHLTQHLFKNSMGITRLQKPDKVFLENTNLMYALASKNADTGNIREIFFLNQLNYRHKVEYPLKGDFLIDNQFTFEIGGKNKNTKQVKDLENAYIALDNVEYGNGHKIPLWMFGFLY